MSDMQDFSAFREESAAGDIRPDSMAVFPTTENNVQTDTQTLKKIGHSLDGQSYLTESALQAYLLDPKGSLPLNAEPLLGSTDVSKHLLGEINGLIQDEVNKIQVFQKRINYWEERVEKNKSLIVSHNNKIKQNLMSIVQDKKNRDYWLSRAETVVLDFSNADAANRREEWAWLVKKYGLKDANGKEIDVTSLAVGELCDGGIKNLVGEYKHTGNQYEQAKSDKEFENTRLIRDNGRLKTSNDTLQGYISSMYAHEIEPLQDGVLLFKEFMIKVKAFGQDPKACYGDLRAWAEPFLDEFIKANPRVSQAIVTEFRKLASISLPAENC